MTGKNLLLKNLINLFEVELLLPNSSSFNEKQLQDFIDKPASLNEAITKLTQVDYQAVSDDSLTDDIYKQNPRRDRSITEAVSNAMDASSTSINVKIIDGFYNVSDNGIGMDPATFFHYCLVPKASSKLDTQKTIGRFGLGFYTALAHLNQDEDEVVLTTKSNKNGTMGFKATFTKIQGEIFINIEPLPGLVACGTSLVVRAKDINKEAYVASLTKNIQFSMTSCIRINDDPLQIQPLKTIASKESSLYLMRGPDKYAVITIGGITIQTSKQDANTNSLAIVWALPKDTSLTESRHHVRIDCLHIHGQIIKLIELSLDVDPTLQIAYLNTIAPLVSKLQEHNAFVDASMNLVEHMKNIGLQIIAGRKYIPDLKIYAPLKNTDVIAIHPLLINESWPNQIGFVPKEWQSSIGLFVAPFDPLASDKMLIDENQSIVFMDETLYKFALQSGDKALLSLLTKYPPGIISDEWGELLAPDASENAHCIDVKYNNDQDESTWHKDYIVQGMLNQIGGDELMAQLSAETIDTLKRAPTLFKTHPYPKARARWSDKYRDCDISNASQLIPYSYQGKQYYLGNAPNESPILLDQHFSALFHERYLPLLKKITQLSAKGITDTEVAISKNDRFCVYDSDNKTYTIINGESTVVMETPIVSAELPTVHHFGSCYVVQANQRLTCGLYGPRIDCYTLDNEAGDKQFYQGVETEFTVLRETPLLIGLLPRNFSNSFRVYDATTQQFLEVGGAYDLIIQDEFMIWFLSPNIIDKSYDRHLPRQLTSDNIRVTNHQGETLFEYKTYSHNADYLVDVYIQMVGGVFYVSRLRKSQQVDLLVYCPTTGMNCEFKDVVGYPVTSYIKEDKGKKLLYNISECCETPIEYFVMFSQTKRAFHQEFTRVGSWKTYISTDKWPNKSLILIKLPAQTRSDNHYYLVNEADEFTPLPIPTDIPITNLTNETIDIESSGAYYLITHKEKDSDTYVVSKQGELVVKGIKVKHVFSSDTDFFVVDQRVYNATGQLIYDGPLDFAGGCYQFPYLMLRREKLDCNKEQPHRMDLIDSNGESVLGGPVEFVFEEHNSGRGGTPCYEVRRKGGSEECHMPHGVFKHMRLNGSIFETRSSGRTYYYNLQGYPLLNLSNNYYTLSQEKLIFYKYSFDKSGNTLRLALTQEQLLCPHVISNISFLNLQTLDEEEFGRCLRFVDLKPDVFSRLSPFMQTMKYVPTQEQAGFYLALLLNIQQYSQEDQNSIISLLDNAYSIVGSYSNVDLPSRIQRILELFGVTRLVALNNQITLTYANLKTAPQGVAEARPFFDQMDVAAGQLAYFLFLDAKDLFSTIPQHSLVDAPKAKQPSLSMLDLMCAYRLKHKITETVSDVKFTDNIIEFVRNKNKNLLLRKLTHALYHQAEPEKALYLREFLQNALDAIHGFSSSPTRVIPITLYKDTSGKSVLSFKDEGVGMTLEQVFTYFLIPGASTKRGASPGEFIGGRGVGLFTAFPGAKLVRLKTSNGQGETYYFTLEPIYKTLEHGKDVVADVNITWHQKAEDFQGTVIERISNEEDPVLHAAQLHRAIKAHARFVVTSQAIIKLNDLQVNDNGMRSLAEFLVPDLGNCTLFQAAENALTAGGLFVTDFPSKIKNWLPPMISDLLFNKGMGIVINFPKNTQLNRERNNFEHTEAFYALVEPYVIQASIIGYINLFVRGVTDFEELPYDFFNRFLENSIQIEGRSPGAKVDAECINKNMPLPSDRISLYMNRFILTDLMCFLNIIPYKKSPDAEAKKVSLIWLAESYHKGVLTYTDGLPNQILRQISFDRQSKQAASHAQAKTQEILKQHHSDKSFQQKCRATEWVPENYDGAVNWEIFMQISADILALCKDEKVTLALSTQHADAMAYASPGQNKIWWNVIHASSYVKKMTQSLIASDKDQFTRTFKEMLDILSHETVHLGESACTGTHNKAFYNKQQKVIFTAIINMGESGINQLFDTYKALANTKKLADNNSSVEKFLYSQLGTKAQASSSQSMFQQVEAVNCSRSPQPDSTCKCSVM